MTAVGRRLVADDSAGIQVMPAACRLAGERGTL